MKDKINYDENFYSTIQKGSRNSASIVVPRVLQFVKPKSVLDVGCGTGEWLAEFKANNVNEIFGVDGDYVRRDSLKISPSEFKGLDLNNSFDLNKRFDLVISLEVAEHLQPLKSEAFVQTLISHSDCVLFSAGIPGQKGTYHINLRTQSYWAELFASQNYIAFDCLRDKLWYLPIQYWYKQNMILYVKETSLTDIDGLKNCKPTIDLKKLNRIHPQMKLDNMGVKSKFLKKILFPFYYLKMS